MEKKLKNIFSEVFNVEISVINDKSSPDNIESWDSLKHTHLIVALEESFNISFVPDEMIEMLNFGLVKIIVEEKLRKQKY